MAERIPESEWVWVGWAAHLVIGRNCQFHLATDIGDYRVSTVGAYMPSEGVREILAKSRGLTLTGKGDAREQSWVEQVGWEPIGGGRTFETMVFPLGTSICRAEKCQCGMRDIVSWSELDMDGYSDPRSAAAGHMAMCQRVAAGEPPFEHKAPAIEPPPGSRIIELED